jgi:hypothetical protein
MKYLFNTYDPKLPLKDGPGNFAYTENELNDYQKQRETWLQGKVIGLPMPTEKYTQEELVSMGMVGVYLTEEGE